MNLKEHETLDGVVSWIRMTNPNLTPIDLRNITSYSYYLILVGGGVKTIDGRILSPSIIDEIGLIDKIVDHKTKTVKSPDILLAAISSLLNITACLVDESSRRDKPSLQKQLDEIRTLLS